MKISKQQKTFLRNVEMLEMHPAIHIIKDVKNLYTKIPLKIGMEYGILMKNKPLSSTATQGYFMIELH